MGNLIPPAFAFVMLIVFIFAFIATVIIYLSLWKIYVKAGVKGWKCLIPIYSYIVLLRFVKRPVSWIIPYFVYVICYILFVTDKSNMAFIVLMSVSAIVYVVFAIMAIHAMSKAFGKGGWFTVGLVLLPIIFLPILAFGDAEYQYGVNQCPNPEPSEIE